MAIPAGDARLAPSRPAVRPRRLRLLGATQLHRHQHARRARIAVFGAAAIIVAALLVVAVGSAFVVSQQVELDSVQQALTSASNDNTNLQLQRAELASPTKILEVAQAKLGMVTPGSVTYLVPVKLGPTVGSTKHIVGP
jgi:cell division protein FtsL